MANSDVSPGLLKKMQASFKETLENDRQAARLWAKIESGKGTYRDAGNYAERVGKALSKAMGTYLTSSALPDGVLYWHIAQDVMEPLMRDEFDLVSAAAVMTQQGRNTSAGIGLKPVKTRFSRSSVDNILGMANNAAQYDDVAVEMQEIVVTFARSVVDQTMKANIDFLGESGRTTRVIRTAAANCCAWCADQEGTYEYPDVPADVYKHHDYCKCDLDYEDIYGRDPIWSAPKTDPEVLEERKTFGL